MTTSAQERRQRILEILSTADGPVSATALAAEFSVSRQIVVGDVALLRASGTRIESTPRGYVLSDPASRQGSYRLVCRHTAAETPRELEIMVDNGCTCRDVVVDHPIYGELTGSLNISSRYDVDCFMEKLRSESTAPLSALTDGVHMHNLLCPSEDAFRRVKEALGREGFLYEES